MFRKSDRSSADLIYLVMSGVTTFASSLMFTTLAVYYVTVVGMNPFQLVLVGTVLECAVLLFEVPTGVVADTFSRRLSVIVGTFILGAAFVLEGLVPLVVGVLVAEAVRGVGETFLLDFSFPALGALKPVVWFGIINIATAIVSWLVAAILGRRLDAISGDSRAAARALLMMNLLIVASVIMFALAGSFALAFAALLVKAVLSSLSGPLYGAWLIQQTSPKARATVLSIGSQSNALGQAAGGPVVGAIGTAFSVRVALVVAGVLLAPVIALYARTMRRAGLSGVVETDGQAETIDEAGV